MYKEKYYFTKNINYLMKINKETNRGLGEQAKLSQSVISDGRLGRYETPSVKTLVRLCNHYKVDIDTLLFTDMGAKDE